jgi:hypothetical protein
MEFVPCKADPDVWPKNCDTPCEYVCVYVDDIMMMGKVCVYVNDIMMMGKDPVTLFKDLTEKYKYNLKCVAKPSYHLGGDLSRDKDGTLT